MLKGFAVEFVSMQISSKVGIGLNCEFASTRKLMSNQGVLPLVKGEEKG